VTPPAQFNNAAVPQAPGIVNYDQFFEPENSADNGVAAQQPATNANASPVNNAAAPPAQGQAGTAAKAPVANSIPQMDFNAPIEQPDLNNINLGQAAPLTAATETVQPAQPAEPADPFSDSALFPSSSTPPAKVALNNEVNAPAVQQAAPALETPVTPAATTEIPKATEEAAENPYSGLTLDDNPFAKPAPRQTVSITPRQIPLEPVNTVPQPSETSPASLMAPQSDRGNASSTDEEPPLVVEQKEPRRPARLAPVGSRQTRAKQEMIAARKDMTGLKGFCPVVLRDDRNLVDAQSQYRAVYNSKTYYLSSSEAVTAFHADPAKYAPAARGCDVIQLAITGQEIEGSLDHAVWYKGRLYMFSSAETMDTFVSAPSSHATLD
jgi:YHS domain-containing protein